MSTLAEASRVLGIDEQAAARVLAPPGGGPGPAAPWYVQLFLGAGAWVTALVMLAFALGMVYVLFDLDDPLAIVVPGVLCLGAAIAGLSTADRAVFRDQLSVALGASGVAMITGGVGAEAEAVGAALAAAVASAVVVAAFTRGLLLQFLASALAVVLLVATLIVERVPNLYDVTALATAAGVGLLVHPPARDLRPTALALLLCLPLLMLWPEQFPRHAGDLHLGGGVARALHLGLFLALLVPPWRDAPHGGRGAVVAFAVPGVVMCALLPPGGSAGLLVLTVAYLLGSRALGLLGVALVIYYLSRFYYDLQMTLLHKSVLLMIVGVTLIGAWWAAAAALRARAST